MACWIGKRKRSRNDDWGLAVLRASCCGLLIILQVLHHVVVISGKQSPKPWCWITTAFRSTSVEVADSHGLLGKLVVCVCYR